MDITAKEAEGPDLIDGIFGRKKMVDEILEDHSSSCFHR